MTLYHAPNRRTFLAGGSLGALALGLAACGANQRSASRAASGPATAGGTLRILSSATDINWDPARSQSMPVTSLALVHRRLTTWRLTPGQEVRVVPDLATDTGTVSADGLSWTFTLKPGLLLDDGTPITSTHVRYGVERTFEPTLSGGLTYHKALLARTEDYQGPYGGQHLDSIETPDESTIVFHLNRPFGDWPWIVATPAFAPVPPGEDKDGYKRAPKASGPYKVAEYHQGARITLARNERWSPSTDDVRLALPDTVVFELGQDESTSFQRLLADSGDDRRAFSAELVSAAQLAQVSANPAAKDRLATSAEGGPLTYLAINTQRVTDVEARRAISQVVDKAAVVAALGGELGAMAASTYITPGIPGREPYDLYPADPQARQVLAGKNLPALTLLTASSKANLAVAEAVAQSLKEAGLRVTIDPVEPEVWTERATQGDGSTYDLAIGSWNPDYPSANANLQPLFASTEIGQGGHNVSRYANGEVDAAIREAAANLDPEAAKAQWAEVDRRIAQDAPVVPLAYRRNSFLHGSGVRDFFVNAYPSYPNYLVVGVGA
ncbi:ABC transporter substrate-binding protein [Actinomyces weissii]|uniref:ABC transporter substrate-binding protein n=1 Tax=Actinomyces weissii TaxID=675090 RepID=A0A7T7S2H8_9ACTO|nr:ABC transporter substrate-binding protein [Actinomyces weissii]QQM67454.1 ABC transporter substrate-binding protein [Actinomyces weissii]